jgi:Methyltransferase domain
MSGEQYDEDYFLRGKQTGKSLYENYRWLPELTIPMAKAIADHCKFDYKRTVLDFGCARGYAVRAFREIGVNAWGYDVSQWALENSDPSVSNYLIANRSTLYKDNFSWAIAKDVLEHVEDLDATIDLLMDITYEGVFVVVPLSHNGKVYDVPEYEMDVTHIHRRPLQWWVGHFHRPGWSVEGSYRIKGIKDNYSHYPTGNGFITCRRLSDS